MTASAPTPIDLEDVEGFWSKIFWRAHLQRATFVSLHQEAPSLPVRLATLPAQLSPGNGGGLSMDIDDREIDVLRAAQFKDVRSFSRVDAVSFQLTALGQIHSVVMRESYSDIYGRSLDIESAVLAPLWNWLDQILAQQQAATLDAHTAPAPKSGGPKSRL